MEAERMNFDSMTAEEVGKLFPIRIEPYNPDWQMLFEKEKALIAGVLGEETALHIEHFGSTAVVGLAAKPTIDILVEVPELSVELQQDITQKLEMIGYGNMTNAQQANKMTFGKGYISSQNCELAKQSDKQTYHVHIRIKGNVPQDEIYFRDYLRVNSEARDEYAKLKYALAEKHRFNREAYTQAKTGFITKITEQQKICGKIRKPKPT